MEANCDILTFFRDEHLALMSLFNKEFLSAKRNYKWQPLLLLCKSLFEENHHEKEEKFIFEAIKNDSRIKAGGPHCTHYFDFYMTNPSLLHATEITTKLTGIKIEPDWSPQMKDILEKNLPLAIPGEDHEAGRIILRGIEHLLTTNGSSETHSKIESLFNAYIEIQKIHFDREENCFFKMCMNLIPPEKWDLLYSEMCSHYLIIS
ncbi:MAG: hypothetical protein IPM57_10065 [Oligoflexia bacterium]|nr:hypothetical protein [Oligoflexia bacterium]